MKDVGRLSVHLSVPLFGCCMLLQQVCCCGPSGQEILIDCGTVGTQTATASSVTLSADVGS